MELPRSADRACYRSGVHTRSLALVALGHALQRAGYAFVTVTPETHRRVQARAAQSGELKARTLRDVFGWNWPFERSTIPDDMFALLESADAIEQGEHGALRSRVRFSTLAGRLFVHSAFPTSAADAVFFGPDTYRFCSLLQRWAPQAERAVDVGCGSGAGGITLAGRVEQIVLADISPQALVYAEINAALAGVSVALCNSDVLRAVTGPIDLIVSNPPYMRDAAARLYRDGGGTYGEALSVRIARESLARLDTRGTLILYTGAAIVDGIDRFYEALKPTLETYSGEVSYEELDPDVFGDELERPSYAKVERIAAVGLRVRGSAAP
jgi:release factor glutamine methyltransferase